MMSGFNAVAFARANLPGAIVGGLVWMGILIGLGTVIPSMALPALYLVISGGIFAGGLLVGILVLESDTSRS